MHFYILKAHTTLIALTEMCVCTCVRERMCVITGAILMR